MSTSISRHVLASSALAAALWFLFAGIRWLFSQAQGPAAQLAALVPEVVPSGLMWGDSGSWLLVTVVTGGIAVAVAHALFTATLSRSSTTWGAAWFATIAAGALIGLALDIAAVWGPISSVGPRGLLADGFGAATASGALWGLAVGWIPGLVARKSTPAVEESKSPTRRPAWLLPIAAVAVIAVVTTGVITDNVRSAAIEAEVAAQQEAEAAVTFGAIPDPDASGVSVPDKAAAATDVDPEWCTPEKAMLLKGEPDAATGHRGLPIRLMNFSDEPCVIEGYPDVAFGDQNQHLLAVTVEQGGSFMAQDPGPQRIEVPAGGYAVSVLGWDAASPHGALVTKTVYAAQTAGMTRGSWPIDLDIVEGSIVAVTAWAIEPNPLSAG
ncbi:MAG: DUF4232 domain-containing protein [Pseudoclavibacter sp.]